LILPYIAQQARVIVLVEYSCYASSAAVLCVTPSQNRLLEDPKELFMRVCVGRESIAVPSGWYGRGLQERADDHAFKFGLVVQLGLNLDKRSFESVTVFIVYAK
jgi:hypothetical protein